MVPVRVARELRSAGFAVDAVVEHAGLRGLPDALRRTASGDGHFGLLLLRSSRFPLAEPDRRLESLRGFLKGPEPPADFVHWLR